MHMSSRFSLLLSGLVLLSSCAAPRKTDRAVNDHPAYKRSRQQELAARMVPLLTKSYALDSATGMPIMEATPYDIVSYMASPADSNLYMLYGFNTVTQENTAQSECDIKTTICVGPYSQLDSNEQEIFRHSLMYHPITPQPAQYKVISVKPGRIKSYESLTSTSVVTKIYDLHKGKVSITSYCDGKVQCNLDQDMLNVPAQKQYRNAFIFLQSIKAVD